MRNNFQNPRFPKIPRTLPARTQPGAPEFQPILKIEIEIDAAGQTRVNRPLAWSNAQFALFLQQLVGAAIQETIKETSMIIDPNKHRTTEATTEGDAGNAAQSSTN